MWVQDREKCESLCPLLTGLGLPRALLWAACPAADHMQTTLRISCPAADQLEIVDKTPFGRNATRVSLDGVEVEKKTRARGKQYMLSGSVTDASPQGGQGPTTVLSCRLVSRGEGWYTRQERHLGEDDKTLVERHVLTRPNEPDVVVRRVFRKTNEVVLPPLDSP